MSIPKSLRLQQGLCAALLIQSSLGLGQEPAGAVAQFEFVAAGLTTGAGIEPRPGSKPFPPEVAGVVRIHGLDSRKSNFRVTLISPRAGQGQPSARPVPLKSWAADDPVDPALFRWTAPWKGSAHPEGWTARIDYLPRKLRQSVSGPIQVSFLPQAQPKMPAGD